MNLQSRSVARSLAISFFLTGISLWVLLKLTWRPDSLTILSAFDYRYLGLALTALVVSWLCDGLRITMMARAAGYPLRYSHGLRTVLTGHFLSAITPFVAGGGPLQAYSLHRSGVPFAVATALVLGGGLIAQLLLVVAALAIALWPSSPLAVGDGMLVLIRTLLIAYAIGLTVFFCLVWHVEAGGRRLVTGIANLLRTRGWMNPLKLDALVNGVLGFLRDLNRSFRELAAERPWAIANAALGYVAYYASFFAVAAALLRGVGLPISYWEQLSLQVPVHLLASILPTPGASGGIEAGMALLYGPYVPEWALGPFVAGWRVLTYYANIVVGAVASFLLARNVWKIPVIDKGDNANSTAPPNAPADHRL